MSKPRAPRMSASRNHGPIAWVNVVESIAERSRKSRTALAATDARQASPMLETLVRQQRRVDAASQVAQRIQGLVGLTLQLLQHRSRLLRALIGERLDQAQPDLERHQLLLGAVVQVALQPPALLVLGLHQPLAGKPQVLQALHQL